MKQIVQSNNRKLLRIDSTVDGCKCLKNNKPKCPLPGKCKTENIICKATESLDSCVKTYIGSKGQSFKRRLYGNCFSIRIENPKCTSCKAILVCTNSSNSSNIINSNLFCILDTPL